MASYNGSPFIEQQIRSVLPQLGPEDELIVVDDSSGDGTPAIVRAMGDRRIRLIENRVNQGVVTTFEQALRAARGEILFLCDDDDVWAPNKVEMFLQAFRTHPGASVVASRTTLIDAEGQPLESDVYASRRHFKKTFWANVVRNHFQGSAMAIRASLLPGVLPFPREVGFLHDHWIGTRNALMGGDVVYLDEPLLLYRRHSQNYSRRKPLLQQMRTRYELLMAHLLRSLKKKSARQL